MRAFVIAAVWAAASPVLAQVPDAAPLVAAENAFAADTAARGIAASFNRWSAPDAVVISSHGVLRVPDAYPPTTPRSANESSLVWWPNFAGVARSGDLGFTTGAVEIDGKREGHYFTIWRKQPDGAWRWVYDGGADASAADAPGPDAGADYLPTSADGTGSAETAVSEVAALEAFMARGVRRDQKATHLMLMSETGRVYVGTQPPAIGRAAAAEALVRWPPTFEFDAPEAVGASAAGDIAWTYGPARWTREDQPRHGYYVHLWQKTAAGWGLVLAQMIAGAPPPAN